MKFVIRLLVVVNMIVFSACSSTWEGVKEDSSEIGKAIGEAAEQTGKAINEAVE